MKPMKWSVLLVLSAVASVTPAYAGIDCRNGYQVVSGNLIATPYCQDKQLAEVARSRGLKVTFAEIRDNPNLKREVCQIVGRDIRVAQTCIDANMPGRRGF